MTITHPAARHWLLVSALCLTTVGCVNVDKSTAVQYQPTDPKSVDIIYVTPYRPYEKVGTVDARWFNPSDLNGMYDSIRDSAATEGANAVIINDVGREDIWMSHNLSAQGTAIRYSGGN